jgi:GTP cyclohydrolase I
MKRMVIMEDTDLIFPSETNTERLTELAGEWLEVIGEDRSREGLLKTPERMAKAWAFLTRGYWQDLEEVTGGAVFESEGSEMVIVKGIEFYSMCEHHLLPFFGKVHIGYIPNQKILGLSKFGRITDMFARRLQVQERLAAQISDAIYHILTPQGVAVVIEGIHLCMMMRGVEKQHSATTTSAMRGVFREQHRTRDEFMSLIATKTLL